MIRAADPETRPQVLEILDSAQSLGLKVLRMWAFDEGPMQYNTLQRYPGQPPSILDTCTCPIGLILIHSWVGGLGEKFCVSHAGASLL